MKGQEEGIDAVVEIIAITMGTAFMLLLFKSVASATEIAKVNVQSVLVTKINEACIKPIGNKIEIDGFSLMQPTPSTFGQTVFVVPKFNILGMGDPEFLVYYEAFPYGEGIGWEVYQFQDLHRIYLPYDEEVKDGTTFEEFNEKLWKDEDSFLIRKTNEILEKRPDLRDKKFAIYVTNVMLSEYTDMIPTREPEPFIPISDEARSRQPGTWLYGSARNIEEELEIPNVFRPVITVNREQKHIIKYRACGKNALCLKTPTEIYRYPLDSACENIENIHLSYSGAENEAELMKRAFGNWRTRLREIIAKTILSGGNIVGAIITTFSETVVKSLSSVYLNVKDSDFYIASPCSINGKITIEKKQCSQIYCDQWIKYPIYAVYPDDNGILRVYKLRDHYQCTSSIRNDEGIKSEPPPQGRECLDVKVEKLVNNYCWTRDPYGSKYSLISIGEFGIIEVKKDGSEKVTIHALGVDPISSVSEYIDKSAILISPHGPSVLASAGGLIPAVGKSLAGTVWLWPQPSSS